MFYVVSGVYIRILLANPRGFCAGVHRAINIVHQIIKIYGVPVYVRHEIVHNRYIIDQLVHLGVVFVDRLCDVPDGSILIFSAHGVARHLSIEAKRRNLTIFDATCPLVLKVHMEVRNASRIGQEVILIGHAGHPEVEGTLGQYTNQSGGIYLVESVKDVSLLHVRDPNNLFFVTQTTLSVTETVRITTLLRQRFPKILGPRKSDICYATFNRQKSVCSLANQVDLVIIVGSQNSSNANRLLEIVHDMGRAVYLVDHVNDIQSHWIYNVSNIGISAAASAPEILVQQIILKLQSLVHDNFFQVEEMVGDEEEITFSIPRELI